MKLSYDELAAEFYRAGITSGTCLICERPLKPYAICCRRRAWMNVKRSVRALITGKGRLA
jgi:hypothetical protein